MTVASTMRLVAGVGDVDGAGGIDRDAGGVAQGEAGEGEQAVAVVEPVVGNLDDAIVAGVGDVEVVVVVDGEACRAGESCVGARPGSGRLMVVPPPAEPHRPRCWRSRRCRDRRRRRRRDRWASLSVTPGDGNR